MQLKCVPTRRLVFLSAASVPTLNFQASAGDGLSPSEATQKRVGGATVAILVRSSPQGHYAGVATRSFIAAKIESIELPQEQSSAPSSCVDKTLCVCTATALSPAAILYTCTRFSAPQFTARVVHLNTSSFGSSLLKTSVA